MEVLADQGLLPDEQVPTVRQLFVEVMRGVEFITKDERNPAQGYMFRGVDSTMNAVGPLLRRVGLICLPERMEVVADERYPSRSGSVMRSVTVRVDWAFTGPAGDQMFATTMGEGADSQDKAVPKAVAVAYRELWLRGLCVPTGEPDVDSDPAPERAPVSETAVVADPQLAEQRANALRAELSRRRSEGGLREVWNSILASYEQGQINRDQYDVLRDALKERLDGVRTREQKGAGVGEEGDIRS